MPVDLQEDIVQEDSSSCHQPWSLLHPQSRTNAYQVLLPWLTQHLFCRCWVAQDKRDGCKFQTLVFINNCELKINKSSTRNPRNVMWVNNGRNNWNWQLFRWVIHSSSQFLVEFVFLFFYVFCIESVLVSVSRTWTCVLSYSRTCWSCDPCFFLACVDLLKELKLGNLDSCERRFGGQDLMYNIEILRPIFLRSSCMLLWFSIMLHWLSIIRNHILNFGITNIVFYC